MSQVLCSMRWVRESGNFEVSPFTRNHLNLFCDKCHTLFDLQVFYWTHFLYLPFWLCCVLHSPNFWKWFIGPFCIFALEKMISLYKSHSEEGKSYVTTGVVLPSRVYSKVETYFRQKTLHPIIFTYLFLNVGFRLSVL